MILGYCISIFLVKGFAFAVIGMRESQRVVCPNIATPTDVLHITGRERVKFASGMKLTNTIWIICGKHTFCTIILF